MKLFDIGNFALTLIGRRILTDDELYLQNKQRVSDQFELFKVEVRKKMYNFEGFIISDFRIIDGHYNGILLQGISVFKEKDIADKYFSVKIDKGSTDEWTELKDEIILDIRDAMRREYINDKENRHDV